MTPAQLRHKIILPVLTNMNMWSQDAEDLLLGTAIHESDGLKRITQYGNGPALSYYQMEPATLADLYENYLRYDRHKLRLLEQFRCAGLSADENLQMNLAYATAATRLQYYRKKGKIPNTLEGQAAYWKKNWNTVLGKGTVEQYIKHYKG